MEFNFATINAQWYYFKFVGASTLNSLMEEDFVTSSSLTNLQYVMNGKVPGSRLWHRTQLIWTVRYRTFKIVGGYFK